MRLKVFAAFCLTLLFAAVCAVPGDPAHAQRARRRGQQTSSPAPQTAAPQSQQQERPKQVIVGRGSDTARGSRMTITSDNPLNDYSAYRSGDRFYVELPNANADTMARAAGKGFSDLQVQRRGKNVVLSYRVRPGAKPRVEQRFNRLEVVFEVPEGADARPAQEQAQAPAPAGGNEQSQAAQNQPANQPPAAAQNPAGDRRTPNTTPAAGQPAAAQEPLTSAAPALVAGQAPAAVPPAPVETAPTPVDGPSPAPAQPGATEVAQAQPPAPAAPGAATRGAAAGGSGASVGAFLVRNWTMVLVAALLLIGTGLLIAARRTSATPRTPAEARNGGGAAALTESPAAKLKEASAPAASAEATAAAATSLAAATVAARESKKAGKKSKKSRAGEVVREEKKAVVAEAPRPVVAEEKPTAEARAQEPAAVAAHVAAVPESTAVEPPVEEISVEEPPVAEAPASAAAGEAPVEAPITETTEIAPFVAAGLVAAEAERPEAAEATPEVKGVEAFAPPAPEAATKEIAPVEALDPERARDETKRLLEGEAYDRGVIATGDAMARQMIAAELLSALSGRNAERRERARAAFVEHGYFDEKAEDLREAEAAAERASAARALGLASDRAATPHLVGALEDSAVEVRRAAVESLASLRDPAAVAPLEALLRREKKSKTKVNRKIVEHAIETCREGAAEEPETAAAPVVAAEVAEETTVEAPAVAGLSTEAVAESAVAEPESEPALATPAEAVGVEEVADVQRPEVEERGIEAAPVEEPSLLVEEAPAEAAPFVAEPEATSVEAEVEPSAPVTSVEPWGQSEGRAAFEEPAASEETLTVETLTVETPTPVAEAETVEVAPPPVFEEATPADAEVAEPVVAETAEVSESSIEPYAEPAGLFGEEVAGSAGAGEALAEEPASWVAEPPGLAEEASGAARGGRADDWVELDVSEWGAAPTPSPAGLSAATFETSAGEPLAGASESAGSVTQEQSAVEPFSFEPSAVEYPAAEPPYAESSGAEGLGAEGAGLAAAPSAARAAEEKGVALFDEHSSVPASIQQRLASAEPEERAAAVAELARVDTGEAFHQLCAAFDDEAREVRSAAARAIYDMQGDRADTFTRALREAGPERRRNIGAAIASSGLAGDAIGQLTGESREKTYESFSLLFLMAKAGEVAPLVRAIEGHPSNEVRLAVVKLLALSGQKEILPAFRRLAVRGSLPTEVRSAVMEAIYQISSQSETTPAA